ncbi:four-carbon acid sugar kinase family protein [Selenihalanaerobacter shriftii]|uniref:Uncharacterized conserved protein YgbK, DUF1537 family n=1 Tax=Selenihalanaerobacter shriftii TaxID=142842 RepID=A0A1T4PIM4_9FIRM|nr:four-carbon acid sugar kinase family protein [Selenihalanaerobacter shriftii]SJZ91349.1 Uncharacterized conserved protein YgbK, DUF1537 family [Selenihalanaerobacter shriftii]
MADKLAIIADDFTGANDTGVQFSKKGLKTVVTSQINSINELDYEADVIVIDTDSRFDRKEEAYSKVYNAVLNLKDMGIDYIYKKLDSTLRGNIGSEIEAAMEAGDYEIAIVAPALPSNGRVTIGGNQLVHGLPLEKTEMANDPVTPINHSYVPDIIKEQTDKQIGSINLQQVIRGSKNLIQEIEQKLNEGIQILVIDSIKNEDLDVIADILKLLKKDYLLVGSAGFAESLPTGLGLISKKANLEAEGSIVGIAGSVSDVTREQVNYAEKNLELNIVDINAEHLFGDSYERELGRIITQVNELIKEGQDIIVRSAKTRDVVTKAQQIGNQKGMTDLEISNLVAEFLGTIANELYIDKRVKGILLTGGDIAIKSASIIGAKATIIEDEVLPGIPIGIFKGEGLLETPIVTKAGAFGEEEAIVEIFKYLRRRS